MVYMQGIHSRPPLGQKPKVHEALLPSKFCKSDQHRALGRAHITRFRYSWFGRVVKALCCFLLLGSEAALSVCSVQSGSTRIAQIQDRNRRQPSDALSALTCASSSIAGSGVDSCKVTLNGAAPGNGQAVKLSSSSTSVTVPASVTVAANAARATFAAVVSVGSAQTATLSAVSGGITRTFALQLSSPATAALTISTTAMNFGNVTVNTVATQSLTLTSSGTAPVIVTAATVTGAGFTLEALTLPVVLNPGQSATLGVQFDPATASANSGQLTIASNSSSTPSAIVGLIGTGTTTSYQVNLNWTAPASSSDAVSGYRVYRSADGGVSFQLLNSAIDTSTTYADTDVQIALAYVYQVTSVDASGVESPPSNTANVTIP